MQKTHFLVYGFICTIFVLWSEIHYLQFTISFVWTQPNQYSIFLSRTTLLAIKSWPSAGGRIPSRWWRRPLQLMKAMKAVGVLRAWIPTVEQLHMPSNHGRRQPPMREKWLAWHYHNDCLLHLLFSEDSSVVAAQQKIGRKKFLIKGESSAVPSFMSLSCPHLEHTHNFLLQCSQKVKAQQIHRSLRIKNEACRNAWLDYGKAKRVWICVCVYESGHIYAPSQLKQKSQLYAHFPLKHW